MAINDDDLDACFSTNDFGVPGTFSTSPTSTVVNGHFTLGSDATVMYGVEIEAVEPSFTCRTSLITGVTRGMTCTVNAVAYKIEKIQKIGTGVSVCYLKTP